MLGAQESSWARVPPGPGSPVRLATHTQFLELDSVCHEVGRVSRGNEGVVVDRALGAGVVGGESPWNLLIYGHLRNR